MSRSSATSSAVTAKLRDRICAARRLTSAGIWAQSRNTEKSHSSNRLRTEIEGSSVVMTKAAITGTGTESTERRPLACKNTHIPANNTDEESTYPAQPFQYSARRVEERIAGGSVNRL